MRNWRIKQIESFNLIRSGHLHLSDWSLIVTALENLVIDLEQSEWDGNLLERAEGSFTTLIMLSWRVMMKKAQTFEEFWSDVIDYGNEVNITTSYAKMSSSSMVAYCVGVLV